MPGSGRYPDNRAVMSCGSAALSVLAAMWVSNMSRAPEVERHRIVERALLPGNIEQPRGVTMILEARQAARFRFVRVDREGLVVAPTGMGDVIDAAAERVAAPAVIDVEGERGVHVDGRMQRRRQLPGLEADAGDILAGAAGRGERQASSVAGHGMAPGRESVDLDLQPLDR